MSLKRGQIVEVDINDMAFPAKGIGELEGKKVYVKNALKGQRVKMRVKKKRKDYIEGKLIDVIKRADFETDSFCKHFGNCGGCARQTVPYEEQLKIKMDAVKRLIDEVGITDYEFEGILPSPDLYSYRNKMEYSFGDEIKGGEMTLGMHKRGQYNSVVTVDRCKLVQEDFNKILSGTLNYFKERNIPHYINRTHIGYLRHFIVRKGLNTGEIMVVLVTSTQISPDLQGFVDMLTSLELDGEIKGIMNIKNDNLADAVVCEEIDLLYGRDYFYDELLGIKFKISPLSFFQTNTKGAEVLYNQILDYIDEPNGKTVFDLYSGTGTIGQIVAKKADKVYGIEIIEEAVEAARENAALNNLDNCEFIAGDVFKEVDKLMDKPDIIIIDPPRVGVHPKALAKILDFNAKEMIYVSCNPKSLAENLVQIKEAGYRVKKMVCVDMFPHTPHVECCSLLTRKK